MRDPGHLLLPYISGIVAFGAISVLSLCPQAHAQGDTEVLDLVMQSERKTNDSTSPAGETESVVPESDPDEDSGTSSPMLQGKTEKIEVILEDQQLYKLAMGAMKKNEYAEAIRYLQMLIPQYDKSGYEPYRAQCMFYEAGCHKNLSRMNAAMDTYNKAYELFAKYDSSNPLKGAAWKEYEILRAMNGRMDSNRLIGNAESNNLHARANKQQIALLPEKAQFAIDPNITLKARADTTDVLLQCNDEQILPEIVKQCFSEMTCLETAEIGSNVTNATHRWMPLKISGQTAAFALENGVKPTFRATVNGRSYLFDINLPGLSPGLRKILVVTNLQKMCAVDVDTFDTWLLRMKRTSDGRVVAARWFKLTHEKKYKDKTRSPVFLPPAELREQMKAW